MTSVCISLVFGIEFKQYSCSSCPLIASQHYVKTAFLLFHCFAMPETIEHMKWKASVLQNMDLGAKTGYDADVTIDMDGNNLPRIFSCPPSP